MHHQYKYQEKSDVHLVVSSTSIFQMDLTCDKLLFHCTHNHQWASSPTSKTTFTSNDLDDLTWNIGR